MAEFGLLEPLRSRLHEGLLAYGTCAGMIRLERDLGENSQPILDVMDTRVRRNAFRSQLDSFEEDLSVAGLGTAPLHAVFIRAPIIERLGPAVELPAELPDGMPVAVRQGNLLAPAFHPKLGTGPRMHQLFLEMCRQAADCLRRRCSAFSQTEHITQMQA